jgi:hypothetical protein
MARLPSGGGGMQQSVVTIADGVAIVGVAVRERAALLPDLTTPKPEHLSPEGHEGMRAPSHARPARTEDSVVAAPAEAPMVTTYLPCLGFYTRF